MRFISTFIAVFFTFLAFSQKNGTIAIPLAQNICTNANYLCVGSPALPNPQNDSTSVGAISATDPLTCLGVPGKTVWYRFDSYSQADGANSINILMNIFSVGQTLTAAVYERTGASCANAADLTLITCATAVGIAGPSNEINLTFNPPAAGRTYFIMIDGGVAPNINYNIELNETVSGTVTGIPLPVLSTSAPSVAFTKKQCLNDDLITLTNSTLVNGTGMRYRLIFSNSGGNLGGSPLNYSGASDTTISLSNIGAIAGFHDFEIRVTNQCQSNRNFGESVELIEMQAAYTYLPDPICLNTPVTFTPTVNLAGGDIGLGGIGVTPITDGSLTYTWNFGDPNSGVNNTFSSSDPLDSAIHTFIGGIAPNPDGSEDFMVELIVNSSVPGNCPADTITQTVTINAPLDINTPDTTFACKGDTAVSVATPINGVPAFTYVWTFSGTSPACVGCNLLNTGDSIVRLANAPDGTYELALFTEDGQGCFAFDTVTVVVGNPDVNIRVTGPLVYDPRFIGDTICPYTQIDYDTTHVSGTGPFTFTWGGIGLGNVSTGSDASISATTQVTLFVTDPQGCISDTDTVTINVYPPATMTPDPMPVCANDAPLNVTLTIEPLLILPVDWSTSTDFVRLLGGGTGNIDSVAVVAGDTLLPLSFTAIGINSVTGCLDTVMGSITVQPPVTVSLAAVPDSICLGDSTTITATSNATIFSWREIGVGPIAGATNSIRFGSATAGTKQIEVSAGDATTLCVQLDTITIVVSNTPQPIITATGNICTNTDITLRGVDQNIPPIHPDSIDTHVWTALNGSNLGLLSSTNTVATVFNSATPDTFTYVYTAIDGNCQSSDTIGIRIHPRPNIEILGNYYREPFCDMEEFAYVIIDTNILSRPIPILSETFTTPGLNPRPAFIPPFLQTLVSNTQDPNSPTVMFAEILDSVSTSTSYPWTVTDINGCDTTATFSVTPFSPPSASATPSLICNAQPTDAGTNPRAWRTDIAVSLSTERSDSVNTNNSLLTGNPLMSVNRQVSWIGMSNTGGNDNTLSSANICFNITTGALGILNPPSDTNTVVPVETFEFDSVLFNNGTCNPAVYTFEIEVYDGATGCTDTINATFEIVADAVVNAPADITQCLGVYNSFSAVTNTLAAQTQWTLNGNFVTTGFTIDSLDTLPIGVYNYIVIGSISAACSDTDTIVVTVVNLPIVKISPIVPAAVAGSVSLCAVDSFLIGPNQPIVAGEKVRWFYGNDTTLLIGTTDTLFVDTFTVSNQVIMKFSNAAGCESMDTIPFTILPLPDTTSTLTITTANSLFPNSTCGNDTVTFRVNLTNPAPATNRYYLQNAVTSTAISDTVSAIGGTIVRLKAVFSDTTTITIIAFNTASNCNIAFNDTITINVIPKPIAIVQADQDICLGTVFKIDGSNSTPLGALTYRFFQTDTTNDVTVNPTADSLLVTITQDSVFMLQVTEIATGCISELDSIRFTVIGSTQAFAGVDTFICAGATYNIADATNIGTTILWTAKSGNPFNRTDTINPTYTPLVGVTGIDSLFLTVSAAGCPDALDTMLLNVVDGARANIISALPSPVCSGDTIFLTGSVFNADSSWASNTITGFFEHPKNAVSNYYVVDSALGQTNVTLSLIAFNGPALCPTDTARVTVNINNGPIAAGGNDTTICQGTSLNLANARVVGTNINWSSSLTAGGAFNNNASANPIFTPLVGFTGTDTLIVTSSNVTCPDSKTDTIIVTVSPAAFAQINTVLTPNTICSGDTLPLFGTVLNADSLWTTNNIVGGFSNNKNTTTTFVLDTTLGQTSMKIFLFAFNGPVGCATDTDSITVTITNGPITALLALDTICQGTALNLSGNTARVVGGNINWSSSLTAGGSFSNNSSATPVFTPLATFNGLDTLVVTSRNAACPKTVNDTLVLRVQAAPVAIITATRDTTCEGFGYQLNSTTQNGVIKWTTSGFGTFDFDNISNPIYTSAANDPFNVQLNLSVEGAVGGGLTCGNAKDSITLQVTKIATATIDKATLTLTNNVLTACNGFDTEISATVSLASDSVLWTASPLGSLIIDNTDPINITITPDPNFTGQAFLFIKAFNAPCDTVRDTLELNVLDGPSFTINPIDANGFAFATDTSCAFEQREIQLNVNNPNPAYSYYLIKPVNDTLGKFENFPGNTPSFIVSPDTTTNFTVSVSAANCSVDSNILINVHRIPTAILPSSIDSVCLNDGVYNAVANITNETEGGFWSHTGGGSWLLNDSIGKSVNYQLAGADTLNLIGLTFTPTDVTRCGLTAFTRPASMSLLVKPNAYFGGISPLSAFTSSVPDQVKFVNDTLYVQQGMKSIIIQADVFNTPGLTWAKSSNAKGTIKNLQRIGNTESIEYRFDKKDGNFSSFYITATPTSECNPLGPDTIHVVFNRISTVNVITPNGDGVNDVLRFNGYAEGGSLVIFDRWGLKVYETNNYRNNWDGEVVEDDTYFYIFKFNGENYTGYVRVMSER